MAFYRGVKDVEFIWRGTQSDPALDYNGYRVNYFDVEDPMYDDFLEDHPEYAKGDVPDKIFDKYCQDNAYRVYEYINNLIEAGAAEKVIVWRKR